MAKASAELIKRMTYLEAELRTYIESAITARAEDIKSLAMQARSKRILTTTP